MNYEQTLGRLCALSGPSGFEETVTRAAARRAADRKASWMLGCLLTEMVDVRLMVNTPLYFGAAGPSGAEICPGFRLDSSQFIVIQLP